MSIVIAVAEAIQILAPLIEETIAALAEGRTPDFVSTLPDTLRSRVALEIKKKQST